MKGQFFLIGALLIVLMLYIGIAPLLSPSHIGPEIGEDISNMFENIEMEYPRAFNLGLVSSSAEQKLVNFSSFIAEEASERSVTLSSLWLITQNVSDNLNITVGNFLGYNTSVTLNVSGTVNTLYVEDSKINSTVFSSPPSEFQLIVNFNTTESNLLLEKYKANFYSVLEIRKGTDKIVGEIKA
ncbi:MAG: hypothetical protein KAS32_25700 [Candidatus Peribacteraceae bacterium]|nr:hypothetical protein [Candidatus Peribacteraceae bacterium]